MNKRFRMMLVLVMAAVLLIACAKKPDSEVLNSTGATVRPTVETTTDGADKTDKQEYVLSSDFYEARIDLDTSIHRDWYSMDLPMVMRGDELVFINEEDGVAHSVALACYNYKTGENRNYTLDISPFNGFEAKACDKGYAGILSEDGICKQVRLYDDNWSFVREIDISGFIKKAEETVGQVDICDIVTYEDSVLLFGSNIIGRIDYEGNLLESVDLDGDIRGVVPIDGERLAVYGSFAYGKEMIRYLDVRSLVISTPYQLPRSTRYILSDGNGGLFVDDGWYIYSCDADTGELTFMDTRVGLGICFDYSSRVVSNGSGQVAYVDCVQASENGEKYEQADIVIVELVSAADVPKKTEIVVASSAAPDYLTEIIASFNRESEEYKVSLMQYHYERHDIYGDPNVAKKFDEMARTGCEADIFVFPKQSDYFSYVQTGSYADLGGLIDEGEFMPNVVEGLTYGGKLYGIGVKFHGRSLIGKKSVLGEPCDFSYEKLLAASQAYPNANIFEYDSTSMTAYTLFTGSFSNFCDLDEGKCYFDTQVFVDLLKVCLDNKTKYVRKGTQSPADLANDVVLVKEFLCDFEEYGVYRQLLGDDMSFVGFPGRNGSYGKLEIYDIMCVSRYSKNQEFCAEFIKYVFDEVDKLAAEGEITFPSRCDSLDKRLYAELNRVEEYKEHQYVIQMPNGDVYDYVVKPEKWTEDDVRIYRELLSRLKYTEQMEYGSDFQNMIYEEAESYFAGKKTAEDVAAIIQSRAQIMVDEGR